MRVIVLVSVAIAGLLALGGTPVLAADVCAPGSSGAIQLSFNAARDDTRVGLGVALQFGLDPTTFPAEQIAQNPDVCPRGRFRAGEGSYTLLGSTDNLPPRFARSAIGSSTIVFLALLPKPDQAFAWAKKHAESRETQATFKPSDMMYVLAVTDGAARELYAFFDTIPDDAKLATAMCGALTNQLPLLGTYQTETGESVISDVAKAQPLAKLRGCAFQAGSAPLAPPPKPR